MNKLAHIVERRLARPDIFWTAEGVARLRAHYGVTSRELSAVRRYTLPPAAAPVLRSSSSDPARTFTATISTPSVDRHGDTVAVDGWELGTYRRAPTVLFQHDSRSLPVARTLRVWRDGVRLRAEFEFLSSAANPLAEKALHALTEGALRATSVGFMVLDFSFSKDPDRPYGLDFKRQELLEWSLCNAGSNRDCLVDYNSSSSKETPAQRRRRIDLDLIKARASA